MGQKVLVTGGAGFIGSHTIVELLKEGTEVVAVDDFSNSFPFIIDRIKEISGKSFSFHQLDCTKTDELIKLIEAEREITGVIHFAANKAVGESVDNPLKYYHNNVGGCVSVLKAMVETGISDFVFSSSCTVYGEPDSLPVFESTPVQKPVSPYGNTKKICEELIEDTTKSQGDLKAVLLRYFNPVGAHQSSRIGELPIGKPSNLIPFITQTAIGKRSELTVFGNDYNTLDGTCTRDYIHVVDLAKAHVRSLAYLRDQGPSSFFDILNVGTGKGNTVLEVIETFEKISGEKLQYRIGPRRNGDVEAVYANTERSVEKLKWQPELTLADALQDAWNWEKKLKEKNNEFE